MKKRKTKPKPIESAASILLTSDKRGETTVRVQLVRGSHSSRAWMFASAMTDALRQLSAEAKRKAKRHA